MLYQLLIEYIAPMHRSPKLSMHKRNEPVLKVVYENFEYLSESNSNTIIELE